MLSAMATRGLLRRSRWTLAMSAAAAFVVLALGQPASSSSHGALSDRVLYTAQPKGSYHGLQARVLGTNNVIALTPRYAPKELFDGAPQPYLYDSVQLSPETWAVSPDGNTAVFDSDPRYEGPFAGGELYAINGDRTGLRKLTRTDKLHESDPVFSPDGKLIAYLQNADLSVGSKISLAVMNADGSGPRTLARAVADTDASQITISWNRDSRRILFTTLTVPSDRSLLIDVVSGTKRQLSGSRAEFSPNGREIAIWYHWQPYVGTVEQISKPGWWRTLRPRAAIKRRGIYPILTPYESVWRADGRLFIMMSQTKEGPRGCSYRSDMLLTSSSGTRTLVRGACGGGLLYPSPTGDRVIWIAGQGNSGAVLVSPTASWKPRPAEGIGWIANRYVWGYQPTKREKH